MKDFYTTVEEWAPIEEMTAPAATKEKQEAAVDAVTKKKEESDQPAPGFSSGIKKLISTMAYIRSKSSFTKKFDDLLTNAQGDIKKLSPVKKAKLLEDLLGI